MSLFHYFSLGAGRDTFAFDAQLERGSSKPNPNSITYGGVINENVFLASKTKEVVEPFGHTATDRHGELWLGVEMVSCFDGMPRPKGTSLDLVVVIDVSGSMDSAFSGSSSKLEAAKLFTIDVAKRLWKDVDEIAIVEFENKAQMVLNPTIVNDNIVAVVKEKVDPMNTHGGTTVQSGLELGCNTALEMKNRKKDRKNHFSRILLLTDMQDGEVRSAEEKLAELTIKAAKEGIYTSYVGIGEDFNDELTEKITVSIGSNYFCIKDVGDFEKRVANEMFSAFFPTIQEKELEIISKQHVVTGFFGAGKDIKYSKEGESWTRETQGDFKVSFSHFSVTLFS